MNIDFSDLKQLVEINSWTKNKAGVDRNGQLMKAWYQAMDFKVTTFQRDDVGDHLLFESKRVEGGPRLLLLGHLDTVFPPESFEHFSEDKEWIYGPGVCDMKGGNFVALKALQQVYQAHGRICNVDVLLVSDEETGSDDSKFVTTELASRYSACLDFEAAGKDHEVVIARKGVATLTIKLTGLAAHAGNHYSDGKNANVAAAKLLLALTELTDLTLGTTVNVGKLEGGIGANTISPHATLQVEARFTQPKERDRVLEQIHYLAHEQWVEGVNVEVSGGLQRDVMASNEAQLQLVDEISQLLGYPLKTEHRGGVSDANVMAAAGVPTLDGFGPFGDGDHTVNERASKSSFVRRIEEVRLILESYQVQ